MLVGLIKIFPLTFVSFFPLLAFHSKWRWQSFRTFLKEEKKSWFNISRSTIQWRVCWCVLNLFSRLLGNRVPSSASNVQRKVSATLLFRKPLNSIKNCRFKLLLISQTIQKIKRDLNFYQSIFFSFLFASELLMPKFENSTRILQFIFASWWLSVTFCWNEVLTILITSASTWSSARQSPFDLWLFCLRGLIHHKPFWRHHVKPVTFG